MGRAQGRAQGRARGRTRGRADDCPVACGWWACRSPAAGSQGGSLWVGTGCPVYSTHCVCSTCSRTRPPPPQAKGQGRMKALCLAVVPPLPLCPTQCPFPGGRAAASLRSAQRSLRSAHCVPLIAPRKPRGSARSGWRGRPRLTWRCAQDGPTERDDPTLSNLPCIGISSVASRSHSPRLTWRCAHEAPAAAPAHTAPGSSAELPLFFLPSYPCCLLHQSDLMPPSRLSRPAAGRDKDKRARRTSCPRAQSRRPS